jgi:hypothetical protein
MKERYKMLNSIYYDLLLQKYREKIGNIGRGAGVTAGYSLDTDVGGGCHNQELEITSHYL